MPAELKDSTVLVTGATGGIGDAIARKLHARGARLLLTGRRVEALDQLQAELGKSAEVMAADLSDPEDVELLIDRGPFDVLIANAALPAAGRYDSLTPQEIDDALTVNLRAPIQLARALVPPMVERGSGHVVLISSTNGKVASPGSSIYSATKFGLRGFGAGLNEDLHDSGVGVTTVFPGFISDAGMFHRSGVKLPKGVGTHKPDDVAAAVIKGIETGRVEIDVATWLLRSGGWLFGISPALTGFLQRKLGGQAVSGRISEGHRAEH